MDHRKANASATRGDGASTWWAAAAAMTSTLIFLAIIPKPAPAVAVQEASHLLVITRVILKKKCKVGGLHYEVNTFNPLLILFPIPQ